MRKRITRNILLGAAIFFAQGAQDKPKPTCNRCSATYIPNEELQQYLKRVPPETGVADQQVRALNVGKTNVDIGIVYRGKLSGGSPAVAEHDHVSEVYHIIDGSGTLVTGPDIEGWKRRPATNENVRLLNGPGGDGVSIRNGVTHHLKPGDVIIIPAGTGHQFTQIDDHIRYLMVRLDPDKIVPLKDEAASKADLRKGTPAVIRRTAAILVGSLVGVAAIAVAAQQRPQQAKPAAFEVAEATIPALQEALRSGKVTSRVLVESYLARIRAYDAQGPRLNAIIVINRNAVRDADALDRERAQKGARGPLHGIPVIVKDNYNTADMPTTAGSIALAGFVPNRDAFQVRKLREAGAVIIAKSNMHELASGITTISSNGGQTHNPYNPARNAGGSSGGTGAAIAASFAAVGMGSDTCGSIRIPSSHNNLVGLRPTKGLSSIDGIVPLSVTQDVAGPLARTVTDLAITLDATIGEDPEDPATHLATGQTRPQFASMLRPDALKGMKLGTLKPLFGDAAEDQEVARIVNAAVDAMKKEGATSVEVPMPELNEMLRNVSVIDLEFREDFETYLKKFPGAPIQTLRELLDAGLLHNAIEGTMRRKLESKGRESDDYKSAIAKRTALQQAIMKVMKDDAIEALVYPTMRRKAAIIGEAQNGSTCQLSASTGFPAISIPAGFTNDGLPVGIELLGAPLDDGKLVGMAYAFEQSSHHRRAPALTPPLTSSPPDRLLTWDSVATGTEVVPPVTTPLKSPIHFTFNLATNELRYTLTFNNGDDQFLYLTLHRAAKGKNGPVTETLIRGTFNSSGSIVLSDVDRKNLMDGGLYVSLGTRRSPKGEVRTQLAPR